MIRFPALLAFIWASHVSCVARDDEVSDSAKFKITSRKEGIEPVVIALILGIVIVGDVAWAVKGIAAPLEIRLSHLISSVLYTWSPGNVLLSKLEARKTGIHKVTVPILAISRILERHLPS